MTKLLIILILIGSPLMAKVQIKNERKPNQASDVTHKIECSGKTKQGDRIVISGLTDIFFNLKDLLSLQIFKSEHAVPSNVPAGRFVYDSSHKEADKQKHKNVFVAIRSPNDEIILNYSQGSKNNKLTVQDFDRDDKPTLTALPSSVVCSGVQVGSYD